MGSKEEASQGEKQFSKNKNENEAEWTKMVSLAQKERKRQQEMFRKMLVKRKKKEEKRKKREERESKKNQTETNITHQSELEKTQENKGGTEIEKKDALGGKTKDETPQPKELEKSDRTQGVDTEVRFSDSLTIAMKKKRMKTMWRSLEVDDTETPKKRVKWKRDSVMASRITVSEKSKHSMTRSSTEHDKEYRKKLRMQEQRPMAKDSDEPEKKRNALFNAILVCLYICKKKNNENEDNTKEDNTKEDNTKGDNKKKNTKGGNKKEDNTKGDNKEDNTKEDNTKGDNKKEDNTKGDNKKEDNTKGDNKKKNIKGGNKKKDNTKGDNKKEDNKKEDNKKKDNTKGDNKKGIKLGRA